MTEPQMQGFAKRLKPASYDPQVEVPLRTTVHTQAEGQELGGQLTVLGDGNARLRAEQPLVKGKAARVLVEFTD